MAAIWMMKSNRKGLHKLLSCGSPQWWLLQWMNWTLWPRENAMTSQILDAEYWAHSKIMGNIELIGTGTKSLQNFVWALASSTEPF